MSNESISEQVFERFMRDALSLKDLIRKNAVSPPSQALALRDKALAIQDRWRPLEGASLIALGLIAKPSVAFSVENLSNDIIAYQANYMARINGYLDSVNRAYIVLKSGLPGSTDDSDLLSNGLVALNGALVQSATLLRDFISLVGTSYSDVRPLADDRDVDRKLLALDNNFGFVAEALNPRSSMDDNPGISYAFQNAGDYYGLVLTGDATLTAAGGAALKIVTVGRKEMRIDGNAWVGGAAVEFAQTAISNVDGIVVYLTVELTTPMLVAGVETPPLIRHNGFDYNYRSNFPIRDRRIYKYAVVLTANTNILFASVAITAWTGQGVITLDGFSSLRNRKSVAIAGSATLNDAMIADELAPFISVWNFPDVARALKYVSKRDKLAANTSAFTVRDILLAIWRALAVANNATPAQQQAMDNLTPLMAYTPAFWGADVLNHAGVAGLLATPWFRDAWTRMFQAFCDYVILRCNVGLIDKFMRQAAA